MANNNQNQSANKERGFATMDPEEQREIASKGGTATHEFDSEEAREASKKSHEGASEKKSGQSDDTEGKDQGGNKGGGKSSEGEQGGGRQ